MILNLSDGRERRLTKNVAFLRLIGVFMSGVHPIVLILVLVDNFHVDYLCILSLRSSSQVVSFTVFQIHNSFTTNYETINSERIDSSAKKLTTY